MAILGGFQTVLGPILGGIILIHLLNLARFYTQYSNALAGIVIVLVVFFFPEGIMGSVGDIQQKVVRICRNPAMLRRWGAELKPRMKAALQRLVKNLKVLFGIR